MDTVTGLDVDKVVKQYNPLVISIAKKYFACIPNYNRTIELDDLISSGNIGLIEACKHWRGDANKLGESSKGNSKFSTIAYFWIRKRVLESVSVDTKPIKFPIKRASVHSNFSGMFSNICDVNEDRGIYGSEFQPSTEFMTDEEAQNQLIEIALSELSDIERDIIKAKYGILPYKKPQRTKTIADRHNIHPRTILKRVKKIQDKIFSHINNSQSMEVEIYGRSN